MAEGNVATLFLDVRSFVREDSEVFPSEALTPSLGSPFVSVYELDRQTEYLDPSRRRTRQSSRTCTTRSSTKRCSS
jgi:hypothetical protein